MTGRVSIVVAILGIMVVSLLGFSSLAFAGKVTPPVPVVSGIGDVRYIQNITDCSLGTSLVTTQIRNGLASTVYTVSANGVTNTFTTDKTGQGQVKIAIPMAVTPVDHATITVSAKGLSQTSVSEISCVASQL